MKQQTLGVIDEKHEFIRNACKKGVEEFVKAIDEMDAIYNEVRFKAFTLHKLPPQSRDNLIDIIGIETANQLKEQRPKYIDIYTFGFDVEKTDEETTILWLSCTRETPAPPSKELLEESFKPKGEGLAAAAE